MESPRRTRGNWVENCCTRHPGLCWSHAYVGRRGADLTMEMMAIFLAVLAVVIALYVWVSVGARMRSVEILTAALVESHRATAKGRDQLGSANAFRAPVSIAVKV